jgi:manganese transport protein
MIMQGFIGFRIPLWVRRVVTMVPSFVVVGFGVNATNALVTSQVVLSLALPFPMMALLWFSCRQDIMGVRKNRTFTTILATVAATAVLSLNALLLLQTFDVALPDLSLLLAG